MDTPAIRKTFLDFFAERGHTIVPSSSLVPDDPTLLLTNAGMVQFKPYFLGEKAPPYLRAASVQKVFRATDLEEVGHDSRHMTFFEMLGNFSFGDYFKVEACRWGWELMTAGYGLDPDRLWATVFETDDEAARIWEEDVGVPAERIVRRGRDAGNFWDMGVAGPCGPCSELLYDRGGAFGPDYDGAHLDDERYLEIWNLVFMENLQNDAGEITGDLPKRNVDTGLGLARLATVLQDVPTSFEIDSMAPVLRAAEEVSGRTYGQDPEDDVSLGVMAEHGRGMAFLIADGVLPSNEGRGYVLRRLIRRAIRYARKLDVEEPFLTALTGATGELFAGAYPELERNRELVTRVVEKEEARFDLTLRQGLSILEDRIAEAKRLGETRLQGEVTFRLHDTYGFPLDLTIEIAAEEGLAVDVAEFETHMRAQRERARAARWDLEKEEAESSVLRSVLAEQGKTGFDGYESLRGDARILAVLRDLQLAPALEEGERGEVVCDRTTFYAEAGGQVGDRGEIRTPTGTFEVTDTRWGVPGLIVHEGRVRSGEIRVGEEASTHVDPAHREGVRQSHTATHMLHWALRDLLGEHARQQGSLVEVGRLRFDFSHFEAVPDERLAELEEEVNRRVLADDSVHAFETTFEYATSIGAMALFGEKYGDYVRVVEVGDYSKELCGGTHVPHTGQVGVIKLLGEGSVAAGVRRVEALTGLAGLAYLNARAEHLKRVAETLRVEPEGVLERVEKLQESIRSLDAELSKQRAKGQQDEVASILGSERVRAVGGSRIAVVRRNGASVDELRKLAVAVREGLGSGVAVLYSATEERANIVAASSRDLVDRGITAPSLIAEGAALLGGGAGGRPDLAVAGGPRSSEIDSAVAVVERAVRDALGAS